MATKGSYRPATAQKQKGLSGRMVFCIIALAVVVAGAAWFIHHRHKSSTAANNAHVAQEQQNGKSTSSSQQAQASGSSQQQPPATQTNKVPTSSGANNEAGQPLEAPGTYSTFVNTSPLRLNDAAQTVCVTTPGATCVVEFQQSSTTLGLPPQTTDATGSAYFNWTPKKAGLSPGNWTIILKASLGGTTKTAQDSQTLQVTS